MAIADQLRFSMLDFRPLVPKLVTSFDDTDIDKLLRDVIVPEVDGRDECRVAIDITHASALATYCSWERDRLEFHAKLNHVWHAKRSENEYAVRFAEFEIGPLG